ncbi:MAG: winged helix-turn-helix domain-containing protein, partial [Geodermatophilaceae bacterium]|nr:winged helix-turn-helix domain-containing protein [Geodermatophilaceae bacterium]
MYFRILGPLQVTGVDGPVAIGGPKARAVLAALLLRRGTAVAPDSLVADVWGAHPPPGALSALRAYVSRLRTQLGAGAHGPRLPFGPGGYTLRVADDELDVTAVERILAEAHRTDPVHAVTLLQGALEHWRGDA